MSLRIDFLIQKLLKESLTSDEARELDNLIRSGRHEQEIKNLIGDELLLEFQSETVQQEDVFNTQLVFENIAGLPVHEKPKTMSIWRRIIPIGVAASLLAGLGMAWYLYYSPDQSTSLNEQALEQKVMLAVASEGAQKFVKLPDGSKVQLNKNSELIYDSLFEQTREVTLKGEAFFDIAHDPEHPFKVRTGKVVTKVLGTAFNVNAFGDDVIVAVTRGLVEVGDEKRVYAQIHPKEKIKVNLETQQFEKEMTPLASELSWKAGTLVIDELTMQQAADTLSKLFHKEIRITNHRISECRVSGTFLNNESLEDILTLVFGSRQATYRTNGDKITVEGGLECE